MAKQLGVAQSTLCRWESGEREPSGVYLAKVIDVIGSRAYNYVNRHVCTVERYMQPSGHRRASSSTVLQQRVGQIKEQLRWIASEVRYQRVPEAPPLEVELLRWLGLEGFKEPARPMKALSR